MSTVSEQEAIRKDILSEPSSRGHFLRGAAIAAASVGLVPAVVVPTIASAASGGSMSHAKMMPESTKSILNIAATAEALAVTAFYNVLKQATDGKFSTRGLAIPNHTLVSVVRAILREEQDHYAFLVGAGAEPLYTSFSFPHDILIDGPAAMQFVTKLETIFVAAYMAANREFASAGMGTLAQYAYQIGGVEAEHRVLARTSLGELPPNNKSFETNLYMRVSDAAAELNKLGLFKQGVAYPSAISVNRLLSRTGGKDVAAGVIQRKP